MAHTLYASGVYMGRMINFSGDLVPPQSMYRACQVLSPYVRHLGGFEWDFSAALDADLPDEFTMLIEDYLQSVLTTQHERRGWKLPETTLAYPWIVRMFPDAKYIFWVRDPRDCIRTDHLTDDLSMFGIPCPLARDARERRAISWKYQHDLVRAVPRPDNAIDIRFEDFVLNQEETLGRLEDFLGFDLARIIVRHESIGRWKTDPEAEPIDFLQPALRTFGYEPG